MIDQVLKRIKRATSNGHMGWVTYINGKIEVTRGDSTRIDSFTPETTIGAYNARADEGQIIEDILHHIQHYERVKAEQSERLNAALGGLHS